jgi:hypothetical protein
VWRAAAPSVDFCSPDIYFFNFGDWARRYRRPGNPVFVPEAVRSARASANAMTSSPASAGSVTRRLASS